MSPTFERTVWDSDDEEATERVGREIGAALAPDGVALLSGDLGAGKTVLTRGIAGALGLDRRRVQSPTFTLIHEHEGDEHRLVHLDLYRLSPEEAEGLGLDELFASPGVKVVEWAERLPFTPAEAVHVTLTRRPEGGRRIEITVLP